MAFLTHNLFYFLLVGLLLVLSGLFSGAETVLFSLSRHDRLRMKKSPNALERLAASLLEKPRPLLTTLLIGNMTCNTLIFILSAFVLANGLQEPAPATTSADLLHKALIAAGAFIPPLLVTYVSDVFPKVVAALNNTRIAPLIALPIATLVRILLPISKFIDLIFLRPIHRLVSGGRRNADSTRAFTADELRELLEMSEAQGAIDITENELLQEVVRLGELRVRDVMTPRVDMIANDLGDPVDALLGKFRKSHLTKMPVYDPTGIDNILGLVYAKEVLLAIPTPDPAAVSQLSLDLRKFLRPVHFVPELLTLDRLIARFRQTRTQLAVAVDEFGGVVGLIALEDIVEQMVGDIYEPHDALKVTTEKLGPDEFRVAGDLSIVDWQEAFGPAALSGTAHRLDPIHTAHTTTIAGLLAAALKRIPKSGDEVRFGHLLMSVESMRGRRVDRVRLKILPEESALPAASASTVLRATPPATPANAR